MYAIAKALKRYTPLIRWTAYRFSLRPHSGMLFEDIEAEGFLTLVKCCREFPDNEKKSMFKRYFKRSWYNRLKDMNRHRLSLKRQGIEVELVEAEHVPVREDQDEFIERVKLRYEEICPLLSSDARRLLAMLLDPTPAIGFAYQEFIEASADSAGHKKFRIRLRHICSALGMSRRTMRRAVREVKSVNKSQTEGERLNGS